MPATKMFAGMARSYTGNIIVVFNAHRNKTGGNMPRPLPQNTARFSKYRAAYC